MADDPYLRQVEEAVKFISSQVAIDCKTAVVLGTGLGKFSDGLQNRTEIAYNDIPHFPKTTLESHAGKLQVGTMEDKGLLVMSGRFHFYEGYDMREVTFPVRVLQKLGVENLLISNAAGGLNPAFETGDLMVVADHINLQPQHPLRGKNFEEFGQRYPDMKETYYKPWVEAALQFAGKNSINCHRGVYAGVQGPSLETPAEFRYLHIIGADAVGMSTVPEVIVAKHAGMKIFAISVISNMGYPPEKNREVTEADVIAMAVAVEPKMTAIFRHLLRLV